MYMLTSLSVYTRYGHKGMWNRLLISEVEFFSRRVRVSTLKCLYHLDCNKSLGENNYMDTSFWFLLFFFCFLTKPVISAPQNSRCTVTCFSSHKSSKQGSVGEFISEGGLAHMYTPVLDDQRRPTFISSLRTLNVVYSTC